MNGWRPGVVHIQTDRSRGSGALIGEQLVLTALHVVSTVEDGERCMREPHCDFGDGVAHSATIEDFDVAQDWALLRCKDAPPNARRLAVAFARPHDTIGGGAARVAHTTPHAWESFGFPNYWRSGTNLGGTVAGWAPAQNHGELELSCLQAQQIRQQLVEDGIEDIDRLFKFAGVSGAPCFVPGTDEIFAIVLANLQQLAAGMLRACPIAAVRRLKHQAWDEVVAEIGKRSESLSPHYDADVYVERALESEIERFICSDRAMMLIVGESGLGKSTLLERIRRRRAHKGDICLALASHRLPAPVDQVEGFVIGEIAGERANEGTAYWAALNREADGVDRRVVIIIDAVNEYNGGAGGAAPAPIDFLVRLDQLASRTRSAGLSRIKYIVSCRSELWRRGGSDRMRAAQSGGAYYVTNGQIAHTLGRYSADEAALAYDLYSKRHKIRTPIKKLSPLTRYYLRDPLLLRLACKVHEHGNIPHELDTSALFKAYAEHVKSQSEGAANVLQLIIEDMFTPNGGAPGLVMTRDAIQRDTSLMRRNRILYEELDASKPAAGGTVLREFNVIRQDGSIRFTYDRFAQYLLSEYLLQQIREQAGLSSPARTIDDVAFDALTANLENGRQLVTTASVLRRTLRLLQQEARDFSGLVAKVARTGEPGLALVVSVMASIASRSAAGIQLVETLLERLGSEPHESGRGEFPVVDAIYQMLLDEEYATWLEGQPEDTRTDHLRRLHTRVADCFCSANAAVSTPALQYSFFLWQNTAARSHALAIAELTLKRVPSLLGQGARVVAAKLGLPIDPAPMAALVNLSVLIELTLAESPDEGILEVARRMLRRLGLKGVEGRILSEFSGRIMQILEGMPNGITLEELRRVLADPADCAALRDALRMLQPSDTAVDWARVRQLGKSGNGYVLQILSFVLSVRYERATSDEERLAHVASLDAVFHEEGAAPGLLYAISLALYHINYFGDDASKESLLLMQRVAKPLLHEHKGHFRLGARQLNFNIIGTLGRALRKHGHLLDEDAEIASQPALKYALDALAEAKAEKNSDYYRYVCDSIGLLGVLVEPRDVLEIVERILVDLSTLTAIFSADTVSEIRNVLLRSLANMRVLYRIEVDRYLLDVLDDYPLYLKVSELAPQFKLSDFQSWTAEQLVFRFLTRYYSSFGAMFVDATLRAVDKARAEDAVQEVMSSILDWVAKVPA